LAPRVLPGDSACQEKQVYQVTREIQDQLVLPEVQALEEDL
jgi:hypothetical protein